MLFILNARVLSQLQVYEMSTQVECGRHELLFYVIRVFSLDFFYMNLSRARIEGEDNHLLYQTMWCFIVCIHTQPQCVVILIINQYFTTKLDRHLKCSKIQKNVKVSPRRRVKLTSFSGLLNGHY